MFDQIAGHPVSQSSRHIKLMITGYIYNLVAQGIFREFETFLYSNDGGGYTNTYMCYNTKNYTQKLQ